MKSDAATTTSEEAVQEQPRRLCSEIQLFDLCELERCRFRDDRFCTDPEMLARFEAVAEPEDRPARHYEDDGDEDDDPFAEEHDDDDYSVFDAEDDLEGRPEDEW